MVILGLDTTTPAGSCAVAVNAAVVREEGSDGSRSPAARLPVELMSLLEHCGMALAEVDVFAVATGPGSFTGLRIGIATMQGLAFAAGKPLVGISALDALAHVGRAEADGCRIATWVDAWRGEVYAALYVGERGSEPPVVARPEDVLHALGHAPAFFIGDGARTHEGTIRKACGGSGRVAHNPTPLLAGAIAMLARAVAGRGGGPPAHAIRPLYVRRTDAELARDARAAG